MKSSAQRDSSAGLDAVPGPGSLPGISLRLAQLESSLSRHRDVLTALTIRLSFLAATISYLAKAIIPPGLDPTTVFSIVATYTVLGLAYFALRSRQQVWAASLVTYPFVLLLCNVLYRGNGLRSGAAVFFVPLLIFAGVTQGRRGLTIFSAFVFCMTLLVAVAEGTSGLPNPFPTPIYVAWLELFVALAVSVGMLHSVMSALQAAQHEVETASQQHRDAQHLYFKAQKLEPMAQLATGVAHDFNNLLGVIANVTASLRIEAKKDTNILELLDDLDEATTRASLMTGQLLAFSRRRAFEIEVIDLEEFVQSLAPLLSRLLGDEIEVQCNGTTNELTIAADRGQLEQVMLNLAVNARDAMPQGGLLTIDMGIKDPTHVFVSVRDTGIGIPEQVRDKIFSAFFTTKETGTGLGLATVTDIVQRLGGTLALESEEGQGSCFTITLPASTEQASLTRRSLSRFRIQRSAARVLLAEDHDLMRRATQRILEQAGYTVTSVVNGQDALALIQGGARFDLLLTDVSMPQLSGFHLAERLAELTLGIPTIFISGAAGHLPNRLENLAFQTRFLAKPFAQEDLIDAIEKCLTRPPPESFRRG